MRATVNCLSRAFWRVLFVRITIAAFKWLQSRRCARCWFRLFWRCLSIAGGFLFGVEFVGGLLVGATIVAIPRALFMGNSGGAFDNAKKYIEGGFLKGHGKGSAAHKAAVTGDTIGDTRKDVVGVALDIFIKTMSTVANTLAGLFSHFTLIK